MQQAKEDLKQKELKEREAAIEAAQAQAREQAQKATAREEVAAGFEAKARRREQEEAEKKAQRGQRLMRKIIGRIQQVHAWNECW